MPFKPPIPLQKLQDIQESHKDDPDILALLWEIKRYHAIAARCDQILRCYKEGGHGIVPANVMQMLEAALKNEPALEDIRALRADEEKNRQPEEKPYRHPSEKH